MGIAEERRRLICFALELFGVILGAKGFEEEDDAAAAAAETAPNPATKMVASENFMELLLLFFL